MVMPIFCLLEVILIFLRAKYFIKPTKLMKRPMVNYFVNMISEVKLHSTTMYLWKSYRAENKQECIIPDTFKCLAQQADYTFIAFLMLLSSKLQAFKSNGI